MTNQTCPTFPWCSVDHVEDQHRAVLEHERLEDFMAREGVPALGLLPGEHVRSAAALDLTPFHERQVAPEVRVAAVASGPATIYLDADDELDPEAARRVARALLDAAGLLDGTAGR